MHEWLSSLAFIGPGGPEFLVVMLVLLMLFGAQDAPRILRKLNEIMAKVRHTADSFKREVMYGDIVQDLKKAVDIDEEEEPFGEWVGEEVEDDESVAEAEEGEADGDAVGEERAEADEDRGNVREA